MRIKQWLRKLPVGFVLLATLLMTISLVVPRAARADDGDEEQTEITVDPMSDDATRSFQKDYFMGILYKKLTDGKGLFDFDGSELQKRKDVNNEIANTDADCKKHSLFDRFGGNVFFEMYLGEEQVKTGLADKVYTAVVHDAQGTFSIADAIDLILRKDAVYTDTYYQNRPPLKNDGSDPRVETYQNLGGITTAAAALCGLSNYLLGTSKVIVSIVSYLASGKYVTQVADLLRAFVGSETYQMIASLIKIVLSVGAIALIFFAVRSLLSFLRNPKTSLIKFILQLFGCLVSMGFILVLITSPTAFINLSEKLLSIGDIVTAQSLADMAKDDEIVSSDSLDNVVEATLWKEAVFKPWVRGTFGAEYENLYTTYSQMGNKWEVDNDAASAYGDISVKRSHNEADDVKNWAALAYSCSSIFHLNSMEKEENSAGEWPKATFVGESQYLYTDDFRWIDASYKVGQYKNTEDKNLSEYKDTESHNFDGLIQGRNSIWLAVLLIPVGIIGFKKMLAALRGLASFAIFLFRSCVNVVSPGNDEYNVLANIEICLFAIRDYIFYCVLIIAGISFYRAFGTNANFLLQLLYFCLAIYMATMKPQEILAKCKPSNIKHFAKDVTGDVRKRVESLRQMADVNRTAEIRARVAAMPGSTQDIEKEMDKKAAEDKEKKRQEEYRQERDEAEAHIKKEEIDKNTDLTEEEKEAEHEKNAKDNNIREEVERSSSQYRDQLSERKHLLDAEYKNKDNMSKKDLKRLKKDYQKTYRATKAQHLQDVANRTFGLKGGTIIPPIIKVYILFGLVGIWLAGAVAAMIMGA